MKATTTQVMKSVTNAAKACIARPRRPEPQSSNQIATRSPQHTIRTSGSRNNLYVLSAEKVLAFILTSPNIRGLIQGRSHFPATNVANVLPTNQASSVIRGFTPGRSHSLAPNVGNCFPVNLI